MLPQTRCNLIERVKSSLISTLLHIEPRGLGAALAEMPAMPIVDPTTMNGSVAAPDLSGVIIVAFLPRHGSVTAINIAEAPSADLDVAVPYERTPFMVVVDGSVVAAPIMARARVHRGISGAVNHRGHAALGADGGMVATDPQDAKAPVADLDELVTEADAWRGRVDAAFPGGVVGARTAVARAIVAVDHGCFAANMCNGEVAAVDVTEAPRP